MLSGRRFAHRFVEVIALVERWKKAVVAKRCEHKGGQHPPKMKELCIYDPCATTTLLRVVIISYFVSNSSGFACSVASVSVVVVVAVVLYALLP